MSLRAKLYLSFSIMIVLILIIGSVALYAFASTQSRIDDSQGQVEYISEELIPVNNYFSTISTNSTEAGLSYYAFSYNFFDSDLARGDENIADVRRDIANVDQILAKAAPEHLPGTRKNLPEVKRNLESLAGGTVRLGDIIHSIDGYRREVETQIQNMDAIMARLFDVIMDDLKNGYLDEKREGMPPVMVRRFERAYFLDQISKALSQGQILFWGAQGQFGEAAEKLFAESVAKVGGIGKTVYDYANSPAVGTRKETKQDFLDLAKEIDDYRASIERFAQVWKESDRLNREIGVASAAVIKGSNDLAAMSADAVLAQAKAIREGTGEIRTLVGGSSRLSMILLAVSLVVGVGGAVYITRSITLPINRIIVRLGEAERTIAGASGQIGVASHELADGANEQAAAIEQTSAALEEMASMTRQNADNAFKTNERTQNTARLVSDGAVAMNEMSSAMTEISDKSDKVSVIIKTISDISFQTNLLALNAAVEAARAGEAGKGFAVVADEVRNLSQRSAQAARDTSALITSTVESVRSGSEIAQKLTGSFRDIEDGTRDISQLIEQIANATNEQAQGVDQVNTAMAQMDKVTQQNSANASATASSSTDLEDQVVALQSDIGSLQSIVYGRKAAGGLLALGDGNGGNGDHETDAKHLLEHHGPRVLRPDRVIALDE